ncbi:MAG TPA: transporter substrate-binding domain-containing protein [Burkholderiaceae bacterium]|nr:transporter substrate-binding domain-containing protein [Burkholderiaceae bacterium]
MSQLMQIKLLILMQQKGILMRRFLLLAIVSFFAPLSAAAGSQELTVQADRWCPYNCEPGTAAPGYVIELLQAIFEPKGIKIRYEVVPWDRTLIQTRDGKADAAIAATQHEVDSFGLLVGSESIGDSSDCLYVGANNKIKFSKAEDLGALKKIGVSSGYSYSADIDAWLKRPENQGKIIVQKGEEPGEINARNLALGRLDGVIEDDHVMQQLIFKFGLQHDLVLAGCQKQTKIYVAFSPKLKNARNAVKDFDEGMEALRQNGQLAKILARYGMTDWK